MKDFDFGDGIFVDMSIQSRMASEIRNEGTWIPPKNYEKQFKNTVQIGLNGEARCPFYEKYVSFKHQCLQCPSFGENYNINNGFECLVKTTLKEREERLK